MERGASSPSPLRAKLGLLVIGLAVLAPAMDTAVNIAMPAITGAFGIVTRDIQWVVTCYMMAYGSLMLTCGKLGDLFGHRRILRAGLLISAAAFALCASATDYGALLAGRLLQGVGIALAISCAPALATALYPESGRTRVLAIYGAIFALGTALGPIVGSWLIDQWGWSAVFAFRVPLVLAALALSWLLPAGMPLETAADRAALPFDWTGALLLVVWIGALMLACAGPLDIEQVAWILPAWLAWFAKGAPLGWLLAGVGMAALAAFLRHETRFPEPIIRPALFRSERFAMLNAAALATNVASFAVLLIVPYYLVRVARLPIQQAGLVLAMNGLGMMAGSWATGRLARRLPAPTLAFAGIAMAALGLLSIGTWRDAGPVWAMVASLWLQGFGVGLFQVAYNDSVIGALPLGDRGVAGSLTMMVRTLGIIGGATGLSALLQHFTTVAHRAGAGPQAFALAFQNTFVLAGGLLLAGLVLSLTRARVWR